MSALKRSILRLGFTMLTVGCAATHSGSESTGNKPAELKTPQGPQAIAVRPATGAECAAGGQAYAIYQDFNSNGTMDEGEQPLSTQVVCNGLNGSNGSNGTNGSNGFSSLFSMLRVNTGLAVCSSGSGLQFNYGLDSNGSQALEPSEVAQAQVLCDGSDGAAGAAGPAGHNGHSMAFQTLSASAAQCPAGGSVVLMSIDVDDSGVYSPLNPGQQAMVMCNGVNGTNGADGRDGSNGHDAVTPAYAPVEPILPCGNTVAYKEVLLRLQNGQVLASFSQDVHGEMTRLAFLPDGTYMDTDSSGCTFSLATSPDGATRFISWLNQVQMSWPTSH